MSGLKSDDNRDEAGKFKPGAKAGPGRPKGARNRLGEAFLSALADDFETHGIAAIQEVRENKPSDYLKVCASILPKEFNVRVDPLEEMTDDQLRARLDQLDADIAALGGEGADTGTEEGEAGAKPAPAVSALH